MKKISRSLHKEHMHIPVNLSTSVSNPLITLKFFRGLSTQSSQNGNRFALLQWELYYEGGANANKAEFYSDAK